MSLLLIEGGDFTQHHAIDQQQRNEEETSHGPTGFLSVTKLTGQSSLPSYRHGHLPVKLQQYGQQAIALFDRRRDSANGDAVWIAHTDDCRVHATIGEHAVAAIRVGCSNNQLEGSRTAAVVLPEDVRLQAVVGGVDVLVAVPEKDPRAAPSTVAATAQATDTDYLVSNALIRAACALIISC